jgi:adenylate cyclase
MPAWTWEYVAKLQSKFDEITDKLDERLDDITSGKTAPAIEDIAIGSARHVSAAVLFFDIANFSSRTESPDIDALKETLYMLDCVIPMTMQVIYDHGGYVEKNTGDGVMGIVGVGDQAASAVNSALTAATVSFYVLNKIVNPHLEGRGIPRVEPKIGIDYGKTLLARIGLPTGSAKHDRNFITAVGPTANIASKIEDLAAAGQIFAGNNVKNNAWDFRQGYFEEVTPVDWTWIYVASGERYHVYHYDAYRKDPEA